jgi:hypothetical protein
MRTILFAIGMILLQFVFGTNSFAAAPTLPLKEAIGIAEQHIISQKIDTSRHYLASVKVVREKAGDFWEAQWLLKDEQIKGGWFMIRVSMDKSVTHVLGK